MERNHIGCLDGLRGLAALWVLIGHAHILAGFRVPLIGDPDIGVDLFIILSGFLMVFHYRLREAREPWSDPATWRSFWLRRFFRIAPLYYTMLTIAIALGPYLYESRSVIDAFNTATPQSPERYLDQSILNIMMHATFLFGAVPDFSYRTALPDWSIGLEMQFYMALPFIMIATKRIGTFKGISIICFIGLIFSFIMQGSTYSFQMPSFLPLKIHVFAAGILMACVLGENSARIWLAGVISLILVLLPVGGAMGLTHVVARGGIVTLFFLLVHHKIFRESISTPLSAVSKILGNRFFHHLGELSFGIYLIHLIVMQPVVAYLIKNYSLSDQERWAISLSITIPISYILASIGYRLIEIPGQRLGKMLAAKRPIAA